MGTERQLGVNLLMEINGALPANYPHFCMGYSFRPKIGLCQIYGTINNVDVASFDKYNVEFGEGRPLRSLYLLL